MFVTEAAFRKMALGLPETIEKSHAGHADFRIRFGAELYDRRSRGRSGGRSRSREAGDSVSVKPKSGKIFATLGYPDERFGVLILTPDQQAERVGRYPEMFEPVKGGWGKRGSTQVLLKAATADVIESAMKMAWSNAAPAKLKH